MILKKLARLYRKDWTAMLLETIGAGCLILSVGIAFGLAPALAATGLACIAIAVAVARE